MARRFDELKLDAVAEALARMESDWSIERRLANEYKVTPKRVRTWIVEVRRRWAERESAMTPDDRRAQLSAMMLSLYAEARRDGAKNVARELLRDIARVWGVGAAEVGSIVNNYFDQRGLMRSPELINARLQELRALELVSGDDEGSGGSTH